MNAKSSQQIPRLRAKRCGLHRASTGNQRGHVLQEPYTVIEEKVSGTRRIVPGVFGIGPPLSGEIHRTYPNVRHALR